MELQSREAVGGGVFFKGLEQEFESTFGDLIPGIIHDFASPLNGILGRSELLGRRAGKTLERAMGNGSRADGDFLEDCKKIHGDAGLLAKEADRLFDLFNSVAEKFRMLKDRSVQEINLSDLVESEAQFQWFYPGIKYDIKKELILDRDILARNGREGRLFHGAGGDYQAGHQRDERQRRKSSLSRRAMTIRTCMCGFRTRERP